MYSASKVCEDSFVTYVAVHKKEQIIWSMYRVGIDMKFASMGNCIGKFLIAGFDQG